MASKIELAIAALESVEEGVCGPANYAKSAIIARAAQLVPHLPLILAALEVAKDLDLIDGSFGEYDDSTGETIDRCCVCLEPITKHERDCKWTALKEATDGE